LATSSRRVPDAGPVLGFGLAHPEQLGEREIREWRIAGELDQGVAAKQLFEFVGLRFAALIAPDDGAAHDLIGRVEQDCAVHLAGETDAGNVFRFQI
jgi:hypothetical protein